VGLEVNPNLSFLPSPLPLWGVKVSRQGGYWHLRATSLLGWDHGKEKGLLRDPRVTVAWQWGTSAGAPALAFLPGMGYPLGPGAPASQGPLTSLDP
jgi:hypothetical protein